jgi:hypothetical protein
MSHILLLGLCQNIKNSGTAHNEKAVSPRNGLRELKVERWRQRAKSREWITVVSES